MMRGVSVDYNVAKLLLVPSEGNVPHMYLDTKGLVTVGIGNMLPSVAAAQMLNFIDRATTAKATADAIKADYEAVTKQPDSKVASYYRPFTKLDLPNVDIDVLFRARVDEFVGQLKKVYPAFDSFPPSAQLALLDMGFNLGTGGLQKKFPKMNAAIAKLDWAAAGTECNRPDVNQARNDATRALFTAAVAEGAEATK
jgi:GH24 family phage-related lysozyme (muramidase)